MAPFFSINKAWGKFLELDAPFSLVLNRLKAMQLIVLLKWKNIVQEFWSDTFYLTAQILIQ